MPEQNKPIGQTPAPLNGKVEASVTGNGKILAAVIGSVTAAAMLFVAVPEEESGRKVEAKILVDNSIQTRHVKGRQYLKGYLDIVGVGTICDGITKIDGRPVTVNDRRSEQQCALLLEIELVKHAQGVIQCTPNLYGRTNQVFAATSLAYNIGVSAWCRSTADKHFDAKRWRQGCDAFLAWNKAGGRPINGLTKRRQRERDICVRGL
jgi:GH24 family phage-related lysozyme (muramidase)